MGEGAASVGVAGGRVASVGKLLLADCCGGTALSAGSVVSGNGAGGVYNPSGALCLTPAVASLSFACVLLIPDRRSRRTMFSAGDTFNLTK